MTGLLTAVYLFKCYSFSFWIISSLQIQLEICANLAKYSLDYKKYIKKWTKLVIMEVLRMCNPSLKWKIPKWHCPQNLFHWSVQTIWFKCKGMWKWALHQNISLCMHFDWVIKIVCSRISRNCLKQTPAIKFKKREDNLKIICNPRESTCPVSRGKRKSTYSREWPVCFPQVLLCFDLWPYRAGEASFIEVPTPWQQDHRRPQASLHQNPTMVPVLILSLWPKAYFKTKVQKWIALSLIKLWNATF